MKAHRVTSLILAGVGGQGIVTSSDILAQACFLSGYAVKKSEVHGMAQRGGSVVAQVRFAQEGEVLSPLIPAGQADLLIGFEMLEALRQAESVRRGGLAVVDQLRIEPVTIAQGGGRYPDDALRAMGARARVVSVPGGEIARAAGNARARGVAVLGAASAFLPLELAAWEKALAEVLSARALECNLVALRLGRELGEAASRQAKHGPASHSKQGSGPQ